MKKKMILFLVLMLLFLVLITNYSQGEEKEQTASFTSGNKYLNWTEMEKMCYLQGLMDMLLNQTQFFSPKMYSAIEEATKGMTTGQIKAIFDKYLEEYPENWQYSAASLFSEAIFEIVNKK